jgi:hypothetical protein
MRTVTVLLAFSLIGPIEGANVQPPVADPQAPIETKQPVGSLGQLPSRLRSGAVVWVLTASGERVVGTFARATDESLFVAVGEHAREIPASSVQQVVIQRGANRLVRGLVIGAPLGAFFGTSPCYRVEGNSGCTAGVLVGTAIGAGIGGLVGWHKWRPVLVFPASSRLPARAAETRAPASETRGTGAQVSLGVVASRVRPFETISVHTVGTQELVGRFSAASDASLTMEINGQLREIPATDIQQIRRHAGRRAGKGALIGLIGGGGIGLITAAASDSSDWSVGGRMLFGGLVVGGAGAMWGAVIGAFVPNRPVVYQAGSPRVAIGPVLDSGRRGVAVSVNLSQ